MSEIEAAAKAPTDIQRRLATILCADVAGYSRMMGENEERTVRVFRGHREIFESLVAQHRGRIFNTAGDALLAEFSSAVEAVRCATDIQAAIHSRNDHLAPEERMQFRIGINLGDVILQGGDLLGDGVNVAARIQAATEPGGICISGSVHDQIQDKLSLEFRPLGEMSYKNIAKPVRTYTIAEGAAVTRAPKKSPTKAIGIVAAIALLAGGGWLAWSQVEAQRVEREQLAAQLAAQKKAAEDAQRAAEDAKRDAQVQAQKQAAEETLKLAQSERARLETEMKLLQAQKSAAPAAVATRPSPAAAAADGLYSGQLCNLASGKRECWPVALTVSAGVVEGSWIGRQGRTSTAKGTITDGALRLTLQALTPRGVPIEGSMVGRLADGAMSASGKWSDSNLITGEWRKGTFATAPLATAAAATGAAKGAARFDGRYVGKVCNQLRDRPEHCWPLVLVAKNGVIEARWFTQNKEGSHASGTIGPDGAVTLTLHSFTPKGEPAQATLSGRAKDGKMEARGEWRGGVAAHGSWTRAS